MTDTGGLCASTTDASTGSEAGATASEYKFSANWVDSASSRNYAAFWRCLEAGVYGGVGYDSEFYGCDITEESPVGKAKVDVFSIAIPGTQLDARGFTPCSNFVFEGRLLQEARIHAFLESPEIPKFIHNQPVDAHAAANHGVVIRGGVNTLSMARFVYPERANLPRGNYDLDSLCLWKLGFGKTEDFDTLLGYDDWEPYEEEVTKKRCECGKLGCRKKKGSHGRKMDELVVVTRQKKVRRIRPLPEVRPGGPAGHLFDRYLVYAAADAELAVALHQVMLRDARKERRYPWKLQ